LDIKEYLKAKRTLIDAHLNSLIPEANFPYAQLFQAARYSLLGSGKRLRPILALAACESLGGDLDNAIIPSCALELIHTYSLIHDDLPCMDNDDFRRGKPTLHKVVPESQALLAGDFLLTYAFEVLAKAPNLTNEKKIQLITILAAKAGSGGMIGGQVMDIESVDKDIGIDTLRTIHQCKTGALICASVEFGGILANADQAQLEILRQFGNEMGLAFQIIDDIRDIKFSQQKHGRQIASDVINKKTTYATLLGIEEAHQVAFQYYKGAIEKLNTLPLKTSYLSKLAETIVCVS
jgi:geranylgeranyl diphosphate synthase, type II